MFARRFIYVLFFIFFFQHELFATRSGSYTSNSSVELTYEQHQQQFLKFYGSLLKWSMRVQAILEEVPDKQGIYFKFGSEDIKRLYNTFAFYEPTLKESTRYWDFHKVRGIEIMPKELANFIYEKFATIDYKQLKDKSYLLKLLVGGTFYYGGGREETIEGFIDQIAKVEFNKWAPIGQFQYLFSRTLTLDDDLANHLGMFLLPFIDYYYQYMEPFARSWMLYTTVQNLNDPLFSLSNKTKIMERLTVKVFQGSGPILIKFLQQIQEEAKTQSPISPILAELDKMAGMSHADVKNAIFSFVKKIPLPASENILKIIKHRLGVASIAQTALFSYRGHPFVIKILRPGVEKIFACEQNTVRNMLWDPVLAEKFDKGAKQFIQNMITGISKELDLTIETKNILAGKKVYAAGGGPIKTIGVPSIFYSSRLDKLKATQQDTSSCIFSKAMVMSVAPGKELGAYMEEASDLELVSVYQGILELYKMYPMKALSSMESFNFFHGDLHRGNIFVRPKDDGSTSEVTLIDFGNAFKMPSKLRDDVVGILNATLKIKKNNIGSSLDEDIMRLNRLLREVIIHSYGLFDGRERTLDILDKFFNVCFNPKVQMNDRVSVTEDLLLKKDVLLREKDKLIAEAKGRISEKDRLKKKAEFDLIVDDIDFINALTHNCLNGIENNILSTLGAKGSITYMLRVVFRELAKNGLSLPTEVIFYNKSMRLLEGILSQLMEKMDERKLEYEEIDFDEMLQKTIGQLMKDRETYAVKLKKKQKQDRKREKRENKKKKKNKWEASSELDDF